jgi:hypothetical protein
MNANQPKPTIESASEQRGDGSRGEKNGGEIGEDVGRDLDQIRRLGEARLEDLREFGGEIRHRVEEQVRSNPLVSIGVAFGAGVIVSSLFSSRLTRLAILAAGGYAAREIFGERLFELLGSQEEAQEEEDEGKAARRSLRRRRRMMGEAVGPSEAEGSSGRP